MSFDSEIESFNAYADAMPNNCILLVDTYDTIQGVKNAIKTARRLRKRGHEIAGIRLDSGDLAYLSIEARKLLDEAGFPDARIVASNNLDEDVIASLKDQDAAITLWGVGTKLVTAYGQPALGGVYKLTAMRNHEQNWQYKIKLSEQKAKINIPGILQVRRFSDSDGFVADMIYDEPLGARPTATIIDPLDETRRKDIPANCSYEDLLIPVFREGKKVYELPAIEQARKRASEQLRRLHPGVKRMLNPHEYPVGLEKNLFDLRQKLILKARGHE
jgi:nicotinate phosphoribosyltransferase